MDTQVEAKFLRTSDIPDTVLFQRDQKFNDEDPESTRSALVGWTNQVNADILNLLKVIPPFDKYEIISVHFLFELKDDLISVYLEEPKMTAPRYQIREMTLGLRIPWFNRITAFINSHYK